MNDQLKVIQRNLNAYLPCDSMDRELWRAAKELLKIVEGRDKRIAELEAQINRVCVRWLDTQDEYGIWYSMTDCGLSETVGEVKSEIQDGRKFCPCCGGIQALQEQKP